MQSACFRDTPANPWSKRMYNHYEHSKKQQQLAAGKQTRINNHSGLGRYQNKRKMNEVFQIKPVNSDNDKFVICLGQFKVSEIDFPTKEAAKKYLRSKPWEIIVNTAILAAKATYIEANEKFNNQNSEENGNN